MISASTSEPKTDPSPPARLPLPITTAAITSNSSPTAAVGSPTVSRENCITCATSADGKNTARLLCLPLANRANIADEKAKGLDFLRIVNVFRRSNTAAGKHMGGPLRYTKVPTKTFVPVKQNEKNSSPHGHYRGCCLAENRSWGGWWAQVGNGQSIHWSELLWAYFYRRTQSLRLKFRHRTLIWLEQERFYRRSVA
jgi:hypothetical protein